MDNKVVRWGKIDGKIDFNKNNEINEKEICRLGERESASEIECENSELYLEVSCSEVPSERKITFKIFVIFGL